MRVGVPSVGIVDQVNVDKMILLTEDHAYQLVETSFPVYAVYEEPNMDFNHSAMSVIYSIGSSYTKPIPEVKYKLIIINGKFYIPKLIKK